MLPLIILWHGLEPLQAEVLRQLIAPVALEQKVEIRLETGFNLAVALARLGDKQMPQAILAPADIIRLDEVAHFSTIPKEIIAKQTSRDVINAVSYNNRIVGMPVFRGNNLMLFYNKKIAANPPQTFAEGQKLYHSGKPAFAWNFYEPYFMLPFVPFSKGSTYDSCPFTQKQIVQGLSLYRDTLRLGYVSDKCDYNCMNSAFYEGKIPFAISGDWAVADAQRVLGDSLGIAPLPSLNGQALSSYYIPTALFFPQDSLQGAQKSALLALAKAMVFPKGDSVAFNQTMMLKMAHPLPQFPNPWTWEAFRKGITDIVSGTTSIVDAAYQVWEVCNMRMKKDGGSSELSKE